jgi:hypothetical protein
MRRLLEVLEGGIDLAMEKRYAEVVSCPPVARFVPARLYFTSAVVAAGLFVFSAAWTIRWWPSVFAAALFALSAAALYYLSTRPAIEIHEHWLRIGNEMIPWQDIRRLDRTRWHSPLVLYLSLLDDRRIQLIFPGESDSSNSLLRFLRRNAREALIDGIPYRQFWGEILPPAKERHSGGSAAKNSSPSSSGVVPPQSGTSTMTSPKYRIVRPEEEEEIERMLQRLKTVGHIDSKSSDEN